MLRTRIPATRTPIMSPLRVLCVTPFGPSGKGGIDRLYFYLRELLAQQQMPGIDLHFARARGSAGGNAWIASFPLILCELTWTLARVRPHVVHINFATGGSLPRKYAVLKLAKVFGARTVVHFHGQFIEDKVAARTTAGRLFKAIATGADRVIALGDAYARAFQRIGVPAERIAVVPNGIPDFAGDAIVPKMEEPTVEILFCGLLTENKGMHVLIPALAALRREPFAWRCVAAGNGDVALFAAMAKDVGLEDCIVFTGWLDSVAMHAHMRRADIVVLPSRTEALPLSLIEGACAGAALVATDVGNVRDILADGVNGFFVAREPDAIADALRKLLHDRARLRQMQAASRDIYRARFTLTAFADRLRMVYLRAAGRAAG